MALDNAFHPSSNLVGAALSLQMFKMSRAPGIQIYSVTALPTARELQFYSLVKKLPSVLSRDLLDAICPAVLSLLQILE